MHFDYWCITWFHGTQNVTTWPQSIVHLYGHSDQPTSFHRWLHPWTFLLTGWTVGPCHLTHLFHPHFVLWSRRWASCCSKLLCPVNHSCRLQKTKKTRLQEKKKFYFTLYSDILHQLYFSTLPSSASARWLW